MATKLTTRAVETATPGAARREIPDGQIAGLFLVVQPTGVKSWAFRYRSAGQTRKLTLGPSPAITLQKARSLAQDAALSVGRGSDPAAEKKAAKVASPVVVKDLVEAVVPQFVEKHAKRKTRETSWKETERLLMKEVVPVFVGRRLSDIDRADVQNLLDGIVDRGAPILANRVLAAFRRMCGWAEERGLVESNPCAKVKAPSAEKSRDRILDDGELRKILVAADSLSYPFGPLLKVLALTGQRRDEVANLKWSEIDVEAKLWTLPRARAKNNVQHTVPLSEPVLAILTALPRISPFVFSTTGKTAVSGFGKAKERLDLAVGPVVPAWVLHDLRRTMVSGMAALGIALPVIEKVVNHTSGSFGGIVGVYQRHSFDTEKRHALDAWAAHVGELLADPTARG